MCAQTKAWNTGIHMHAAFSSNTHFENMHIKGEDQHPPPAKCRQFCAVAGEFCSNLPASVVGNKSSVTKQFVSDFTTLIKLRVCLFHLARPAKGKTGNHPGRDTDHYAVNMLEKPVSSLGLEI